jgi:predicted RNase H-like HicB family nuclease
MEYRYHVVVYRDVEDGRYNVMVPALPGCVTFGDTRDEALAQIRDAISLSLEVARHDGDPIPSDSAEPEIVVVEGTSDPSVVRFVEEVSR